jgi:hypothetical protein
MKYIVPNSKTGLANKFVDYILSEIDKNNDSFTVLEVVIFNEFFVINGLTSVKDRIDLNEIKQKFYDENKSLLSFLCFDSINTIDLIKYDSPIHEFNMCFDFHSSYRPLYHEKVLEYVYNHQNIQWEYIDFHNSLTLGIDYRLEKPNHESYISEFGGVKSGFPHGFSLNYGRTGLYYCEYIANHLFSVCKTDKISFKFKESITDGIPKIEINCKTPYPLESVNSMVLDVFDLNLTRFKKKYLQSYDLKLDVDNQRDKKPWLIKDKLDELFFI